MSTRDLSDTVARLKEVVRRCEERRYREVQKKEAKESGKSHFSRATEILKGLASARLEKW